MFRPLLPLLLLAAPLLAQQPAATPPPAATPRRIEPGKAIVPTEKMRRIWGELVSMDLHTRTGTFRNESTEEIMPFTVLPYAELLHHAAFGDLDDFRIGERAIFRLHENDRGEWVWLTYIQDEMNMMNGHREYFYVDRIDPEKKLVECTQANFDRSFVREKGIVIETDAETRFWKAGRPASFADIHVGDQLRTKTHGLGKGKVHRCWEVFLDDASLQKFQSEQKAAHAERMAREGAPGYVDSAEGAELAVTLFQESGEVAHALKMGDPISVAPAGVDRGPTARAVPGKVESVKYEGPLSKVAVRLEGAGGGFAAKGLVRLWK